MKKKVKIRSFEKRLTWGIALTQLVVMALASYYIYKLADSLFKEEEQDLYKTYLELGHSSIRAITREVEQSTLNHRQEIEDNLGRPDKIADIMERIVADNPNVHSCGISFVADYYPGKGRWFCPLAVMGDSGQVERRTVGNAANDYLKADWFTQALQADSCYWAKPFFDATDSIPLVAWLMPVHNRQGQTVAIVGADISLGRFGGKHIRGTDSEGKSFNVYLTSDPHGMYEDVEFRQQQRERHWWRIFSYNFIIDKDGTYIAHPDSSLVIKANFFERAKATPDTIDDGICRRIAAGERGFYSDAEGDPDYFRFFDFDGFNAYLFFQPVQGTGWSIAMTVPRLLVDGIGMFTGGVFLLLIAIALLVTRIVGRIIIKHATKPLKKLADSAGEVAKGNFNAPLPYIKHNDEIRLLRDSFEGMQRSLADYVEELKETTASKAAIENELKVAHDIQMSMLPKMFPPYPERSDVDVYGMLTPAKDVGGDLFDFFIRDEQLFFCVGDVSGKGVPAALVMTTTCSLFRNIAAHVAEPHLIANGLNLAMTDNNETIMFVTLFIGVLDLATGRLAYCNAGHNAPLLVGRDVSTMPCEPNLPVGIMADREFVLQQTVLAPGTTIFLFTDGLNEAENAVHGQFGDERVAAVAAALAAEGNNRPAAVVGKMAEAVGSFVGDAEQSDDLTMLAIKYLKTHGNERE